MGDSVPVEAGQRGMQDLVYNNIIKEHAITLLCFFAIIMITMSLSLSFYYPR